jgi:hypothetical protein
MKRISGAGLLFLILILATYLNAQQTHRETDIFIAKLGEN